jgi:hypothetical protein
VKGKNRENSWCLPVPLNDPVNVGMALVNFINLETLHIVHTFPFVATRGGGRARGSARSGHLVSLALWTCVFVQIRFHCCSDGAAEFGLSSHHLLVVDCSAKTLYFGCAADVFSGGPPDIDGTLHSSRAVALALLVSVFCAHLSFSAGCILTKCLSARPKVWLPTRSVFHSGVAPWAP